MALARSRPSPDVDASSLSTAGPLLRLLGGGDVGDWVAARAAPAADEQDYRAFLEALGVAVYTTDARGRITFFNGAAADFWGRRPELGEEWCGTWRLYYTDGRPMAHAECPMAV